jgi:hypothetical protein
MRRTNVLLICLLLTLPMLAGCTGNANGDGDADPTSDASTVIINNYYNNTTTAEALPPLEIIHSINSNAAISIDAGEIVEIVQAWSGYGTGYHGDTGNIIAANVSCLTPYEYGSEHSLYFIGADISAEASGNDFLPTSGEACTYVFHDSGGNKEDIFIIYRVHNINYHGLHFTNSSNQSTISIHHYSATDHSDVPDSGTEDSLFVLQFVVAPSDFSWANLSVQIIAADGNPITCNIDAGDGSCKVVQYGSDDLTWEQSEIIHVTENGLDICSASPCSLTIQITTNGFQLSGSGSVVVE